jgi:hypothetical protein
LRQVLSVFLSVSNHVNHPCLQRGYGYAALESPASPSPVVEGRGEVSRASKLCALVIMKTMKFQRVTYIRSKKLSSRNMKFLLPLLLLSVSIPTLGQLNNTSFDQRLTFEAADSNRLYAGVHVLGFGKNNEYFSTTVEGYTLFGYQFNPYLTYFFRSNIRLDAGVFLQQDFGNANYSTAIPTLSLNIKDKNFQFTIGTLEGSLHHQLIEPIYDFERVLNNRVENGIQFQWMKDGLFADGWVNWEKMIYFKDPDQERFVAGVSVIKRIKKFNNWLLEVPVQATVRHAGGQIDTSIKPLTSIFTSASGLIVRKQQSGFINEFGLKSYFLTYKNLTSRTLPYNDGNALYLNPYLQTRSGLGLMASYWYGNEYLTLDGGQYYPVYSIDFPERLQQARQFYMLRLFYELKIADGLHLTARVEPFYDTLPETIQYSYGFYLNFSDRFFLGHAKRK